LSSRGDKLFVKPSLVHEFPCPGKKLKLKAQVRLEILTLSGLADLDQCFFWDQTSVRQNGQLYALDLAGFRDAQKYGI
jgi:hypothetical protein